MSDAPSLEVFGQGDEWQRLQAAARALRLPHALVIEGGAGSGKTVAALALAAALLDDGGSPGAIDKQVVHRNHADLHWLSVPEGKSDIPIESVRALQGELQHKSFAGRARVAVIDGADRLNEQGQNALLKTLEEPGEAAFLLLTTRKPEALLPTVRSRVARYRMRLLGQDAVLRALERRRADAEPALRAWAAACAEGALGLALELIDQADLRALTPKLAEFVAGRGDPHALVDACLEGVTGREAGEERVRTVLRLLRAQLRAQAGLTSLVGVASGEEGLAFDLRSAYGAPLLDRWIEACERVFEAEADVHQHIGAEQVLLGVFLGCPVSR